MSGYSYRNVGKFESEQDVDEWARNNRVDSRDFKSRKNRARSISAILSAADTKIASSYSSSWGPISTILICGLWSHDLAYGATVGEGVQ